MKKNWKWITGLQGLLVMVMSITCILGLMMTEVKASSDYEYIEYTWNEEGKSLIKAVKTVSEYTMISAETVEWTDGWYVATGAVTIDSRVIVSGDVKLLLVNGAELTVNGGIKVRNGNTLTVYAQSDDQSEMGTLIAQTNSDGYAVIGGDPEQNAGTITFNGGNIEVTNNGYKGGAGIGGGGYSYREAGAGGITTINGGFVTVTMKYQTSVGIGGGSSSYSPYGKSCGTIMINGGTVKVNGSGYGIGSGNGCSGREGTITINGGTVVSELAG